MSTPTPTPTPATNAATATAAAPATTGSIMSKVGKGLAGAAIVGGIGLLASGIAKTIAEKKRRQRMLQLKTLLDTQRKKIKEMNLDKKSHPLKVHGYPSGPIRKFKRL